MFFKIVIILLFFKNLIYKYKKPDLDASFFNIILMQVASSIMGSN